MATSIPNLRRASGIALCMMLAACAVGPNYKRPDMHVPAGYKETPEKSVYGPVQPAKGPQVALQKASPQDEHPRGPWWEVFGDTGLNQLESQVAITNQNVKAAEASFRQARAMVAEARAAYFPTLGANTSFTRNGNGGGSRGGSGTIISTGTGSNISTGGGGGQATTINNYNASLDASWAPDLWGRVRREVESSKAGAEASAADLASATLSAQGTLAIDYLGLRMADEQTRLLGRAAAAYQHSLIITENQYTIGVAAQSDVLQARVQLETTQAQLVDVGTTRAQYEHAIAVLIGKVPADFSLAPVNAVAHVPDVPPALPAELLQRRPDIAGAERRVAAANASIGVAEAAFFPDITLSASGGYASTELAQWFSMPSRFWSIGPSLVETLFDAGLRAAQTEAAIAAYDQAVATYRQTVLTAFQGVEDNLAALNTLKREADVLDGAVRDADKSVIILTNQYKAGTVSYLNVVTAQTAALNDAISALNVRKAQLTATATLIEDLGGGWDVSALKRKEVTTGETGPLSILPPSIHRD